MIGRYFDYNATTPLDGDVKLVMIDALDSFGNPSGSYQLGIDSKKRLDLAREQVASLLGVNPNDIYFTSGGTEANNCVIKGFLLHCKEKPGHIITTQIEHPSILEVFRYMETNFGFQVSYLPVGDDGIVNVQQFEEELQDNTQFISIMLANNELGSIQPIRQLTEIATRRGVFFHTDATQAIGKMVVDATDLKVDALTISAHKFYGPKGVGALYIKEDNLLDSLIHGGGQESGVRGGTENIISIIGMGKACELLSTYQYEDISRNIALKKKLLTLCDSSLQNTYINGTSDPLRSLCNTVNIRFCDVRAESIAAYLNEMYNISVSLGSACSNHKEMNLSHVLQAIGLNESEIKSSIRLSFGRFTREEDIYFLVESLQSVVTHLRKLLPTA
jgi:cysteine desulfurase